MRTTLPLLLICGCGYSSYYPNYPDWLIETGTAEFEPTITKFPCSPIDGYPVDLTLVSTVDYPLHIAFVSADSCEEQLQGILAAQQSRDFSTTDNLVWTVRDSAGTLLSTVQVPSGVGTFVGFLP